MPYIYTYSGYEYDEPEEHEPETVSVPCCPKCGDKLLYDGDVKHPDGAEGETWRCASCDYCIDIVY